MNKIKNLEQLKAEKLRLKVQIKESELEMQDDIAYFTGHLQSVFNVIDITKNKINHPVIGGIAKLLLPLFVGRVTKKAKVVKSSFWGIAATMAAEYFAKDIDSIKGRFLGFISRWMNKSKKRDNEEECYYD